MQEPARAKLNLALHVRGREADGYHRLETIFAFAEIGDVLSVGESEGLSLEVRGPFAAGLSAGDDNLVLRAAAALRDRHAPGAGAALVLEKNLPVAAGLGGGSADAAAALRLLARWWRLEVAEAELRGLAAVLGADVPACLLGTTARGEGKGDRLSPAGPVTGTPVLLVNPGVAVSTAEVFRRWNGVDRGPLGEGASLAAALGGRNDLEPAAIAIAPVIAEVLAQLRALGGVTLARMSGSGATCFALFDEQSDCDEAAMLLAGQRPDWWVCASRLR